MRGILSSKKNKIELHRSASETRGGMTAAV
jgi:hypothetical protein